jgi:hypothetical protein
MMTVYVSINRATLRVAGSAGNRRRRLAVRRVGPACRAGFVHALEMVRVAAPARPAFFGLDVAEWRARHRKIGHGFQAA